MLTTWEYFNKMTKVLTTEANDEIRVAVEIDLLSGYKKIVMCVAWDRYINKDIKRRLISAKIEADFSVIFDEAALDNFVMRLLSVANNKSLKEVEQVKIFLQENIDKINVIYSTEKDLPAALCALLENCDDIVELKNKTFLRYDNKSFSEIAIEYNLKPLELKKFLKETNCLLCNANRYDYHKRADEGRLIYVDKKAIEELLQCL